MIFLLLACLLGCEPRGSVSPPPEPLAAGAEPVGPGTSPPPSPEEQIIWISIKPNDPCEYAVVGTKAALFWHDDAAGTLGPVDLDGVVVAREESRIGIKVRGTLPPGTRAAPAYAHHMVTTPECAGKKGRRRLGESGQP